MIDENSLEFKKLCQLINNLSQESLNEPHLLPQTITESLQRKLVRNITIKCVLYFWHYCYCIFKYAYKAIDSVRFPSAKHLKFRKEILQGLRYASKSSRYITSVTDQQKIDDIVSTHKIDGEDAAILVWTRFIHNEPQRIQTRQSADALFWFYALILQAGFITSITTIPFFVAGVFHASLLIIVISCLNLYFIHLILTYTLDTSRLINKYF